MIVWAHSPGDSWAASGAGTPADRPLGRPGRLPRPGRIALFAAAPPMVASDELAARPPDLMPELRHNRPQRLDLAGAAAYLSLAEVAVQGLVDAGYLRATAGVAAMEFAVTDLKAFLARNDDNGAGPGPELLFGDGADGADPQALLDALDGRSEEMARRALEIFSGLLT